MHFPQKQVYYMQLVQCRSNSQAQRELAGNLWIVSLQLYIAFLPIHLLS